MLGCGAWIVGGRTSAVNDSGAALVSQFEIRLSAMLERTLRRPERLNSLRQWALTQRGRTLIRHKRTSPITLVRSGNRMMFARYGPLTIDFAQADRQDRKSTRLN